MVSAWSTAFGIAAIASAVGFIAASIIASLGAASGRANLRRIARGIGVGAAVPLLALASHPPAQPFVAFAVVAALPAPQPVALALAAGAAVVAGLVPSSGVASIALGLAGAAAAMAAHALGRSLSAYLGKGSDVAWPASAAGATAGALVIAMDGGGALRWSHGLASGPARVAMPDAGLVLGLVLLASLAGALLLGADALAAAGVPTTAPPAASPLARMLGRRAMLLAAGLSVIAAGLVFRVTGFGEAISLVATRDIGVLAAIAGLLSCAVPPLLAGRMAGDAHDDDQAGTVISRLVVVVALAAVFASAAEGWLRSGTYLTPLTARLLAASLVAFAASETMHLRALARALALAALLLAVLGP
jgi:hypothetical protein